MKQTLCLLLTVAFLSGCVSRYQTYTLIEGSEIKDDAMSSSSAENDDPNNSSMAKEKSLREERLVKRVLVDHKTGDIYYFQDLDGVLQLKKFKK